MIRIKLNRFTLVYFSVFILCLNFLFSALDINWTISENGRYFAIFLLLINIILHAQNTKFRINDVFIICICLVYYLVFNQSVALNIMVLYLISYFLRYDDINNVKTNFFNILTVCILIWILFLFFGIAQDNISTSYGRVRHYLGFKNINQSAVIYLPFLLLMYERFRKKAIPILIAILLFVLTNTRASFLTMSTFVILSFFSNYSENWLKRYRRYVNHSIIFTIAIITVVFIFSGILASEFPMLDALLSNRLSIIFSGITALTRWNYIFGGAELLLDNSYIMLFSTFGILGLVIFLLKADKMLMTCSIKESIFLISVLVYGLLESTLFVPESTLAMLLFIYMQHNHTIDY